MASLIYSLALYLLTPLFFCFLFLRGWRERAYWRGWKERLGYCGPAVRPNGIVVHAVSVGEVNAAQPLIRALAERYPDLPLTITCFTATGAARIKALFAGTAVHCYWPLDLPGAVRRFLQRSRPRLVIILETEIWPNFYARTEQMGIPLMLVNARISDTSFRRYQRFRQLTATALAKVDRIAAQSAQDQQRLLALGAPAAVTHMSGNLKYDLRLADTLPAEGRALRLSWGAERPVWLAASTREGEEAIVVAAFQSALRVHPDALLVIVPRHPERFEEVARLVESSQLSLARFSQSHADVRKASCYLVDAMGELLRFYAACDVAFVGGSLANTGGHNVLEAAALARPVLVGPNTFNFAQITQTLVEAGAAQRVQDADSLQQAVIGLLGNPEQRQRMGQAGRALVAREQGALSRSLQMVTELLRKPRGN